MTGQHHDGGLLVRMLMKESNSQRNDQGAPCVQINAENCRLLIRLEVRRKIEEVESCKVGRPALDPKLTSLFYIENSAAPDPRKKLILRLVIQMVSPYFSVSPGCRVSRSPLSPPLLPPTSVSLFLEV